MGVGVGVSSGEGLLCGRGDLGPARGRVMLSSDVHCMLTYSTWWWVALWCLCRPTGSSSVTRELLLKVEQNS